MHLIKQHSSAIVLLMSGSLLLAACGTLNDTANVELSTAANPQAAIVKSPIDTREYSSIVLDNQLEVVLVSDPSIEKSAAALSVKVGSYQEPKEFGGLAHYLEHMLFLGTKTYPEVGDYSEFVSRNGGTQNAYTELDHTNYMVAVNNDAYDEALQRFSGFFYEATLDEHYADKERNAVHSEWSMKSPNDWIILSQLNGLTLNPAHPVSQFNWGNLDSLSDKPQQKLQDALLDLYNTYYSANLMKAAMISNKPIAEMERLARQHFGKIPNKNTPLPEITVPVASTDKFKKIIHYVPQADMKQLRVSFVIDNNSAQFAVKPNGFVNYILNNEMPGTLASALRDAGLSEALYTSYDADEYGNAGSFNLYIDLTESGLQNRDKVMAAVLKYLELLRKQGVDKQYFNEIKQSLSNSFRFKEKTDDYDYAMQIAADLQHVPTAYVLSSQYEYQRFNPQAVQKVLDQLILDNARIFYIDKSKPAEHNIPYFAGQYSVEDISEQTLTRWQELGAEFVLNLPRINKLMPENFDLVKPLYTEQPKQLANEPGYSAFLGHSAHFEQPKGLVTLDLNSGVSKSSARNQVSAELLNRGLNQSLTELQNEAAAAGMGLNVSLHNGLSIAASGFNDKQGELLRQAIKHILAYNMSESELANYKAAFKSDMFSKKKGILLNQLFPKFSQLVILDEYSDDALLAAVDAISLADLSELKEQLIKHANLRVFAYGNYDEKQITALSSLILSELPSERQFGPVYESPRLTAEEGQAFNWQEDVELADIGLVKAYISPCNERDMAAATLLSQLLQPALFKQIRTEEQLAYAVGFFSQTNKTQMLTAFYIQSPAKGLAAVDERINAFRQNYVDQLAQVSADEFATTKNSVLISLTQPPKNLNEEMGKFVRDWRDQNYAFDSRSRLIAAVEQVSLQDVVDFYRKLQDGKSFVQVMIQMRGTGFADEDFASIKDAVTVTDIDAFHQQHK